MNLEELQDVAEKLFRKKLFKARCQNLKPPPKLSILEWAVKHYTLGSEDAAEPGKYSPDRAKYQRGILETIGDHRYQEVVLQLGSQTGKTLIQLIVLGYYISQDPSPILLVLPDKALGQDFSKRRLTTLIKNHKEISDLFKNGTKNSDTITSKYFPGGSLKIASAGVKTDLTSMPIRVLLMDETDKFPLDCDGAGSPINLAKQRTATFFNKKIIQTSTPLVKGVSVIESAYLNSDQRSYHIHCVNCSEKWVPVWDHVKWKYEDDEHHPDTAHLYCPHCDHPHNDAERQRAVDHGEWVTKYPGRQVAGFHLSGLVSPWVTLQGLVEQFLQAQSNPLMLKQFVNEILAETWAEEAEDISDIPFLDRCEDYTPATIPNDVLFLTAGCDTQDDRIEVEIVGWGEEDESWSIRYEIVHGAPDVMRTWKDVKDILTETYYRQDGVPLKVAATCIDSGGHFSEQVKHFAKNNHQHRFYAVKGASTQRDSIFPRHGRHIKGEGKVYMVGTWEAKNLLFRWLKESKPGPGYCHFPKYDAEYFSQLTAEQKKIVKTSTGRTRVLFEKTRERNEALDCRVYALAARYSLPINFKKLKQNLFEKAKE